MQRPAIFGLVGPAAGLALLLGGLLPLAPALALAQEDVPLDQLLKLPSSSPVEGRVERRGGVTRAEWLARFQRAREAVEEAEEALAETRAQLEELSGEKSAWKMSAPGLGNASDPGDQPMDYKLSTQMRRQREELARAERRLQDLEVEANLAGIPPDWRGEPQDEPQEAGSEIASDAIPEPSSR